MGLCRFKDKPPRNDGQLATERHHSQLVQKRWALKKKALSVEAEGNFFVHELIDLLKLTNDH